MLEMLLFEFEVLITYVIEAAPNHGYFSFHCLFALWLIWSQFIAHNWIINFEVFLRLDVLAGYVKLCRTIVLQMNDLYMTYIKF